MFFFRYQDAIAVCRKFHKPDYFITFTCNPLWPEIQNELKPHQTASSRPDIVVRVFQLKLKGLIDDLRYKGYFCFFFLNEPLYQEEFRLKKFLLNDS